MSQQPQQIQLNPVQLLQITSEVLGQLKTWVEKRPAEEVSHPEFDATAARSLHHARLICNVRLREIVMELQKAQENQRMKELQQMTTQRQANAQAARVLGLNSADKTIEDLWREAGLHHYLDTGRP